jgi:phage repressor protein C with HTH and peptisase S24 domain
MRPDEIRALREKLKLSQPQLAKLAGTSQQNVDRIESGDVKHSRYLKAVVDALASAAALGAVGEVIKGADLGASNIRTADVNYVPAQNLRLDVPVKGLAVGGEDSDFQFNGETVDYVRRPAGLAKAAGIFAIYVRGSSMAPRYDEGDLVYVSTTRPPSVGDYVILEMAPGPNETAGKGFIKRLKARAGSKIICEQFNPPGDMEFDKRQVLNLYRVVPNNELYGV